FKRSWPLLGVFFVRPFVRLVGHICFGAFLEGHAPGPLNQTRGPFVLSDPNWVYTVRNLLPRFRSRASARVKSSIEPSPMCRARPSSMYRNTHDLVVRSTT